MLGGRKWAQGRDDPFCKLIASSYSLESPPVTQS